MAAQPAPPVSPSKSSDARAPRAITIAILAMGGEGGGVLADWIVDLAEHSGYCAQTTSVPGVAQRTGSTIYYLEIFPEETVRVAGKEPVLALMPVPGELDIVLASELMEAGRAIQRGLVTPDRTTLITSTNRVYSMTEKTAITDGRVDSAKVIEASGEAAKVFVHGDFARIAEDARSVISASLFGALAATGALPFRREQFEEAIRKGGVGVDNSLAAFAAGFRAATERNAEAIAKPELAKARVGPRLQPLVARIESEFPPASREILVAGIERLADYQDLGYASEYLARLEPIRDADKKYGPGACELLNETARYLALWMSYEDAPRVADLKIRRTRFERVHRDARVDPAQLLQINEFLHPRVQEIADMSPAGIGRWMLKSSLLRRIVEALTGNGKIVQTTSLRGYLQLYMVAGGRRWRRKSLRFEREQKSIAHWLALLPSIAQENYTFALELAECPRMVKGYGDTHAQGERNYEAVLAALPKLRSSSDAASRLKRLREAALADDSGERLAKELGHQKLIGLV
ncbi:MAG: indolepyruvate oxidoreductase subunit beta family protein [Candidatus Acidiferrales bacterium]